MAKQALGIATFLTFAICISGLVAFSQAEEEFTISGYAFCDTCRVEFQTNLSYPLPGVKVGLECFNETTKVVTFKTKAESDKNGSYKMKVPGDHDEEICEVTLLESTDPKCKEVIPGSIRSDRVPLTIKNGVYGFTRFANVLSFATKEALPDCTKILLEMGVLPEDFLPH